jgi:orotidine-5'-phosphate decarboxylase
MQPLYLAADHMDLRRCSTLLKQVGQKFTAVKVHHLWDQNQGKDLVRRLKEEGANGVWADLKLHDTPDTVAARAQAVANAGALIVTMHASGGVKMMQAAVKSGIECYAITVLTSLTDEQAQRVYGRPVDQVVRDFAEDAVEAGARGIVCSSTQVAMLNEMRKTWNRWVKLVVPGTRSVGVDAHDQEQVNTPLATMERGADYLVIGRQVTAADDPGAAMMDLVQEIAPVVSQRREKTGLSA